MTQSAQQQPSTNTSPSSGRLDIHQDVFRLAAGLTAITVLFCHFENGAQSDFTAALAISIPLYILAAHLLVRTVAAELKGLCSLLLGFLDAALTGAFIYYIDLSPLPSSVMMLMVLYSALIAGGAIRGVQHILALSAGAIGLAFSPANTLELQLNSSHIALSFAPLVIYLCFYGYYHHRKQRGHSKIVSTLEQRLLQLKLRTYKLSKYLSPALRKEILSGKEVKLETQRKKLTVFFSDLKGFSELTEELEAETLTALLNNYLTEMSDIALRFGATVDKFMGDGIMVFFGDPSSRGTKQDCVACVSMAIAMKKHMKALQLRWLNQGIQRPLEMRMGVNTGYCTVGNFGTENRLDYTLLGTDVNLASRLESAAEPGEILISHETYSLVKDVIACEDKGQIRVKGYHQPVQVYSAVELRKNLGKDQTYFEHATDGFSVYMDMDKINNYDRERILSSLKDAARQLECQQQPEQQSEPKKAEIS